MSTEVTPAVAPEVTVAPIVSAVVSPPPVAATPLAAPMAAPANQSEPTWLPDRIKQAKDSATKELLKSLGYENSEAAVAAIADLKKRQDAEKTETQRLTDANALLTAQASKASEYESILKSQADAELAKISNAQRAAIQAIAGADPIKQVAALNTMRAAGMFAAPAAVAAPVVPAPVIATPTVPAVAPTPAAPATTTPAPGPSATNPGGGQVSHTAVLAGLRATNPILAGAYALQHYAALQAEKNPRS